MGRVKVDVGVLADAGRVGGEVRVSADQVVVWGVRGRDCGSEGRVKGRGWR